MPRQYRAKPVVIEAEQWIAGEAHEELCTLTYSTCLLEQHVHTLNGPVPLDDGDWIIRGVKGEVRPCKPDIFAATYELVDG